MAWRENNQADRNGTSGISSRLASLNRRISSNRMTGSTRSCTSPDIPQIAAGVLPTDGFARNPLPRELSAFDYGRMATYILDSFEESFSTTIRDLQCLDKGKPIVRSGRKAMGLIVRSPGCRNDFLQGRWLVHSLRALASDVELAASYPC